MFNAKKYLKENSVEAYIASSPESVNASCECYCGQCYCNPGQGDSESRNYNSTMSEKSSPYYR